MLPVRGNALTSGFGYVKRGFGYVKRGFGYVKRGFGYVKCGFGYVECGFFRVFWQSKPCPTATSSPPTLPFLATNILQFCRRNANLRQLLDKHQKYKTSRKIIDVILVCEHKRH